MHVYVFGAGASVPYGLPTMSNLLREAFGSKVLTSHESTPFDNGLEVVAEAIDNRYGLTLAEAAQHGGEHFSAVSAIALEKINIEHLLARADQEGDTKLRAALERVIFSTLEWCKRPSGDEYGKLVRQLRSDTETGLISLNWDLELDHALADAALRKIRSWSYCIPFEGGIDQGFRSYHTVAPARVYLLKLHGSLNWLKCARGHMRFYYFMTYDGISRTAWPPCEKCQDTAFSPCLVAPGPLKDVPLPIEDAWKKAAECLRRADALTVIGYSFPAFDQQVFDLFLKSFIVPNLKSRHRPPLTIVDPDECVRKRIKDWFNPAVDAQADEYASFQEYLSR